MHKPIEETLCMVKCVLCYLKGIVYHGLFLPTITSLALRAYSNVDDCTSTIVCPLYYWSGIISWSSRLQHNRLWRRNITHFLWLLHEQIGICSPLCEFKLPVSFVSGLFCDNICKRQSNFLISDGTYFARYKVSRVDFQVLQVSPHVFFTNHFREIMLLCAKMAK